MDSDNESNEAAQHSSEKSSEIIQLPHYQNAKLETSNEVPLGEILETISTSDSVKDIFDYDKSNEGVDTTSSITFIEELDIYGISGKYQKTNFKAQYSVSSHDNSLSEKENSLKVSNTSLPNLVNNTVQNVQIKTNYQEFKMLTIFPQNSNQLKFNLINMKLETEEHKEIQMISFIKDKEEIQNLSLVNDDEQHVQIAQNASESSPVVHSAIDVHNVSLVNKQNTDSRSMKSTVTSKTETNQTTKEFKVVPVNESSLVSSQKVALNLQAEKDLEQKIVLLSKSQNTPSEGEINNQDTIGPLENPAFLRSLHYTDSLNNKEAFEVYQSNNGVEKSNEDLRSASEVLENSNLDRGWAWVILAASFFSFSLLGATAYAAGVFMSAIIKEVEPDITKVSWVGSVNVCFSYLAGPFVGVVQNKLGTRLTVSLAGIVLSLAFVGAAFSNNIIQLILTHGLLAGLGAGYTLNPMFVSIGHYFYKYRSIACGLLACGTGLGILTGGTVVSLLLEVYGLSGTYLIWAGLLLHITPASFFLRPSQYELSKRKNSQLLKRKNSEAVVLPLRGISKCNSMMSIVNSNEISKTHSITSDMCQSRKDVAIKHFPNDASLLKSVLSKLVIGSGHLALIPSPTLSTQMRSSKAYHHASFCNELVCQSPVLSVSQSCTPRYLRRSSRNLKHLSETILPQASPISLPAQLRLGHSSKHSQGNHSYCTSMTHISRLRSSNRGQSLSNLINNDNLSSTFNPNVSRYHRYDSSSSRNLMHSTSFMGSIMSVPAALIIVNDDISKYDTKSKNESQPVSLKKLQNCCYGYVQIFHKRLFLIYNIISFFWAIGESPLIMYLPSLAIDKGSSAMQASSLYTTLGIGSILGRFLSSITASNKNLGCRRLFTGGLFLTGILTVMSPFLTSTFNKQMVFSALLGLYTGSLVPLSSLIVLEMLDASELSVGIGIMNAFQGIGYLLGPPIASFIISKWGYNYCYIVSGIILLLTSAISMVLSFHQPLELEDQLSLTDLHESEIMMDDAIIEENSGSTTEQGESCLKEQHADVGDATPTSHNNNDKLCTIQDYGK